MKANICNIQKFSIHDGPGIRTVVFFKGCPLRCLWCSNPETQLVQTQLLLDKKKCESCKKCDLSRGTESLISENHVLHSDGETLNKTKEYITHCTESALKLSGKEMDIPEIIKEVMKDFDFYEESGGGATLSGGEVLLWHEFAIELLKELRENGVSSALETTGFAKEEIFQSVAKNADLLLYDVKHYDDELHKKFTGVSNELILKNLSWAIKENIDVVVRIPVIPKVNDSLDDARQFVSILKEIGVKEVNVLPFHQFGENKYDLLEMNYELDELEAIHSENLVEYKNIFDAAGLNISI